MTAPTLAQRAKALFLRGAASDAHSDQPAIIRPLPPDIAAFPDSLTELDQWVLWRSEHGTKRPYSAITKRMASTTSPADWASFEAARAEYDARSGFYSGFGFVFSGDDGLAGIDLDDCILGDGSYKPWAQRILERIESYSEVSPSGRGVKIWVRAKLPAGGLKRYVLKTGLLTTEAKHPDADGAIEVYDHGRYFTVTGRKTGIVGVEYCQAEIEALYAFLSQADAARVESRTCPRLLPAVVEPGGRHAMLCSVAGAMWRMGLEGEEIRAALLIANQDRCKPPKSDRDINIEIKGILDFLTGKPHGVLPRWPREIAAPESKPRARGPAAYSNLRASDRQ